MKDKFLVISWALTILMGVALLLQMTKPAKSAGPDAPQELHLLARSYGQSPNVNVWSFRDPETGEKVMVMTGKVVQTISSEIKRTKKEE